MRYKLQVYSIWEYGSRKDAQGNPHQEDSMYPAYGQQKDSDRTFILCDGMGGHGSGEVASAAVCEAMSNYINTVCEDDNAPFTDADLKAAISAAYTELDKRDTHEARRMGTTMTLLKLHTQGATIAHIGDSRVYHIRPGQTEYDTHILFQTRDHSLVNDLISLGELTPEEARNSPQKNVITRSMMPGEDGRHRPDIKHITDIKAGDYFYLCSDGMLEQSDMEDGTVLRRIFSAQGGTDERRVQVLKGATDANKDNHTAFIIHILEVSDPIEMPASMETAEMSHTRKLDCTPYNSPIQRASNKSRYFLWAAVGAVIIALGVLAITKWAGSSDKEEDKVEAPTKPTPVEDTHDTTVIPPTHSEATPAHSAINDGAEADNELHELAEELSEEHEDEHEAMAGGDFLPSETDEHQAKKEELAEKLESLNERKQTRPKK